MLGVAVGIMTTRQKKWLNIFVRILYCPTFFLAETVWLVTFPCTRVCVPCNNLRIRSHTSIKLGIHSTTVLFIAYL
jgi:hypothetical protein